MNEEPELDELAPWLLLIITLMGGGLRVVFLAENGLWLDETFSVWLANHSVGEMLPWLVRDRPTSTPVLSPAPLLDRPHWRYAL